VVAALSIWNVGVAFLFGLATQWMLRRKLLELSLLDVASAQHSPSPRDVRDSEQEPAEQYALS
jgi:hypothetical protein